jgi:hypothetical protein
MAQRGEGDRIAAVAICTAEMISHKKAQKTQD